MGPIRFYFFLLLYSTPGELNFTKEEAELHLPARSPAKSWLRKIYFA